MSTELLENSGTPMGPDPAGPGADDSLLDLPAPERLPWREALAGLGFAGLIVLLSGLSG